jgi:tRNA U34 5-methylaminomethyl-2-thiouridine-forming methyltransferase MnmC
VASLVDFPYPEIFEPYRNVIADIATLGGYEDERTRITVEITDARAAMRELEEGWDVCYQDAFSPQTNPVLWTKEYFADVARLMGEDGIVTTYSTALSTRLALYENGFKIYLNAGEGYRNATIATRRELPRFEKVDMEHKIRCNPSARPLSDENPDL